MSKHSTDKATISGARWQDAPELLADLARECDEHANTYPDSLAAMVWQMHEGGDVFGDEEVEE